MMLTFVRHAEIAEEYIGKYNGHIDISLSQIGHGQAKELATKLQNENFDAVYCSDLLRARQTLDAFNLDITPTFTKNLREKSWGIHEGKNFLDIEKSGIKYKNFQQWLSALDGEDINTYLQNTQNYFEGTLLQTDAKKILVITHSGFIKTLIHLLHKLPLEEAFTYSIPYASSLTLNTKNKKFNEIT